MSEFDESLSNLKGAIPTVSPGFIYPNPEEASIQMTFPNRTVLNAEYWRIIKSGGRCLDCFDHLQIYGLPERIDAVKALRDLLHDRQVIDARLDHETGDLIFDFAGGIRLQVLNFTAYEMWQIVFPDGTGEYSNHV